MVTSTAFLHAGYVVLCCSAKPPAKWISDRSKHRLPNLAYRSTCSRQCPQLSRSAEDAVDDVCYLTACRSVSIDDATTPCHNNRRICLLALAGLSSSLMMSQQAAAIPLAPLGNSSDTIGGPKLQQPSLKQVQVGCFARGTVQDHYPVLASLHEQLLKSL